MPSPDDVYLWRSELMDKAVITRTDGMRLGYVNQLYIDPANLEVVSLYLRPGVSNLRAASTCHVMLSSLRQVGDVVLVHDKRALMDPPADETVGCYKLVGSEVTTETGATLGRVRDVQFSPDTGALWAIRYDLLGLPSLPQSLLSCYSVGSDLIKSVGPNRVILFSGAEQYARKENDGWVNLSMAVSAKALGNVLTGIDQEADSAVDRDSKLRSDPAYLKWYAEHGEQYERYYGQQMPKPVDLGMEDASAAAASAPRARRQAPPRALPPPQSMPYAAAVQQQVTPTRQAVPVQRAAPVRQAMPQRMPQQGSQGSSQGMLLDVQRRPAPRQQVASAPAWPPAAPQQPRVQQQAPLQQAAVPVQPQPMQSPLQQQPLPPPQQPAFRELLSPDKIVQPDGVSF